MKKIFNKQNIIKVLVGNLINSLVCCICLYFLIADESWMNLFVTFFQGVRNNGVVLRTVVIMFPIIFIIIGMFRLAEEVIFYKRDK